MWPFNNKSKKLEEAKKLEEENEQRELEELRKKREEEIAKFERELEEEAKKPTEKIRIIFHGIIDHSVDYDAHMVDTDHTSDQYNVIRFTGKINPDGRFRYEKIECKVLAVWNKDFVAGIEFIDRING